MAAYIHALSTAVPTASLRTPQAAELLEAICPDARTARRVAKLLPHTGIEERHLAAMESQATLDDPAGLYRRAAVQPHGPGTNARSLAFDAAADRLVGRLLEPLHADDFGGVASLVTVSCTHASSPGLERPVFAHSPLSHGIDRWNLGFMGCSAALAALRLATRTSAERASLIVACELSSLHFQYSADLEQLTANLLFADGAAAVVMRSTPSSVRVLHGCCAAVPHCADDMLWWAGDFGLRLSLSPDLPATLAAHLPDAISRFCDEAGTPASAIEHWLVHPGGPQILDVVEQTCALPSGALRLSRAILRQYGNMSSPTILFILRAALEAGLTGKIALLAFGPGLTIETVLVDVVGPSLQLLRGPNVLRTPTS